MKKNIFQFIKNFNPLKALINSLLRIYILLPKKIYAILTNFFDKINFFKGKKTSIKVSNFNKFLITFIAILFCYLFYLTIPNLYDKLWVQQTIEKKLVSEFNINFDLSSDLSYVILPSPHFLIKNAVINENNNNIKKVADIKNLKVFISQKNLFNKNKLFIKKVIISESNFIFNFKNFEFITNLINNKFSEKKLFIKKTNLFLKDDQNDTLLINKVHNGDFFYDNEKELNQFLLKGKVFNIPYSLNLQNDLTNKKLESMITSKKLKLKFNNILYDQDKFKNGSTDLFFMNSRISHDYKIIDNEFSFSSKNSSITGNKINYKGKIELNPFNFVTEVNLDKIDFKSFLNNESIINELLKSEVFFNENLNSFFIIKSSKVKKIRTLKDLEINFKINQGEVSFDNSKLKINKIGILKLVDSSLVSDSGELILNGEFIIDVDSSKSFYKFFQTPKRYRKNIDSLKIVFNLNIQRNQLFLSNISINNTKSNLETNDLLKGFNSQKKNFENLIELKNFTNNLLAVYEG